MTLRNWFFPRTSHAIADLFRRRGARRSSRPRRGRPTLASLASEALEPRSMMAVTPPSISIDDVTIVEGNDGTKNAAITLRLSQPSSTIVSLRFATANGTATAGSDFVAKAGGVSFAARTTTKQVLIAIKGDRTYEPNETFSINLSSPKRATIADRSGTVTIANNDPAPTPAPAPAPAATPSPAVGAAPMPTLAVTPSAAVTFSVASDWGSGFNGDVTVRNTTTAAYANWTVEFDFDGQITSLWNGVIANRSGSRYTVRNESWNGSLATGSSTAFGFTATPGGSSAVLRNLTLVGSGTPTPTPIDGTTGRVFLVNPAADDIVGFQPSRDRLDFADVSVHNLIIAKTETGEVAIVNPWASTPEFQVLRGISYRDLTMANFGVVQNEHLRQDIGGVVSWEQGIGPRDGSTVYVRSHEYGVRQRIDGFNPATMKLSFLYFGTRERLSLTDTAEGLSISVLPTNQSILLVGVTKAQLVPGNVEFHHDQIVEDQLEVPFGHPAEHFALASRSSLLTPTAPAGQITDGNQTSIGQPQPGGHDHGTMPTPTPTPTAPANGDLWKEQFFAPYVDMGQYPVPDLDGLARKHGVGLFTLGFMQASPSGKLAWGGYDVLTLDSTNEQAVAIRGEINALRAIGGDVMVSLGGAAGISLAQSYAQRGLGAQALATAYGEMVDTLKLTKVDFDIEGTAIAETQTLKLQMDAIALVQKSRAGLGVWLTLPVLPQGLTLDGVNAVKAALVAGVKVDGVNVMAMDYGDSAAPPTLKSMGEYAIDAANATFAQMTTLFASQGQSFGWNQLGVTPMIGVNDVQTEVFTLQDADRLETFARAKGLGMLSMWSLNRDNPGPTGQLSNTAAGIPTIPAGGFSITWGDYGSDPAIVGGVTPVTPVPVPGITIGDVSVSEGNPQTSLADGYLHTSGNQILDATNKAVRIAGVNWFGFETTNFAPHGLWARGYKSMMDQMKSLGFNTIRLPYCDQLFDAGSTPNGIDFSKNADLQGLNGLQIMDKIVAYAGQIGLKIVLDHHRSEAGNSANASGLWYTAAYPESKWVSNLTMLAARYAVTSTVIGIDLHNEPHGPATWGDGSVTDWRLAAERGGNAVLAANPNLLVIVEGIETASSGSTWWGGNLSKAGAAPVRLSTAGRLVYSAHDYPASVYAQPYFSDPSYPNNLPAVWDKNWGYLFRTGTAPVLLGEFGSTLATASDRAWYSQMVNYLKGDLDGNGSIDLAAGQQGISWTYWSWNPNSGDTGGILAADWQTVNTSKVDPLKAVQFQFPAVSGTVLDNDTAAPTPTPPATPTPTPTPTGNVVATSTQTTAWGTGFNGAMKIKNTGTTAINGWTMEFDMQANMVNIWNAVIVSHVGTRYVIKNADWNGTIAAGAEIAFGFQADGVADELPSNKKVNGVAV